MSDVEIKEEPVEINMENINMRNLDYEDKLKFLNEIAQPLANKKLCKKIFKLMKKAHQNTNKEGGLRHGLKNVARRLMKDEKGIVILAGNVSPIDIYIHLPIVCEERSLPYCFVPTRDDLGQAIGLGSRGPIVALITPKAEYQEAYDECWEKIKLLPTPV